MELLTESAICGRCQAEVREGSVFCYNCGTEISAGPGPDHGQVSNGRSDSLPAIPPPSAEMPGPTLPVADKPISPSAPDKHTSGLPTAASLRRRRPKSPQVVEVLWEESQGSGLGFVIGSAVLAVITVMLVLLSIYMR